MEDDTPVIYGLEFQARALCSQAAETDAIRFFVGTQSLKFDNQIHQVEFDEETGAIHKNVFLHKEGEIWHLATSPTDLHIISTCYNKVEAESMCSMQSALWRIPDWMNDSSMNEDASSSLSSVELLCKFDTEDYGQDIKSTVFHPTEGNKVVTIVDNHFLLWDITESSTVCKMVSSGVLEGKGQPKFTTGKWNPHQNCTQFVTANDTHVRSWDLRTSRQAWCIEGAHCQLVRDMDFNPNRQYYMASCGDDGCSKFWDIRKTTEPVMMLSDHSHWVWSIRYNHFHDQLVLTSSSDSRVILTSVASISSEPYGHLVDDEVNDEEEGEKDKQAKLEDGVLGTYDEHEDSVYAVEWSSADPWTFASLSYDGRLVVNRVPRAEKYKILL